MPTFLDVKTILDNTITNWAAQHGRQPDLTNHDGAAPMTWNTRAELLAAVGHGYQLIQPAVIGVDGNLANLVIDLRVGLGGVPRQMPKSGPYVAPADIQTIVDWITQGCPA